MPPSLVSRAFICALVLTGVALPGWSQTADGAATPSPTASGAILAEARPAYTRPLSLGQLRQIQQIGRTVAAAHRGETQDAADPKQLDQLRQAVDTLIAAEKANARVRSAAGGVAGVAPEAAAAPSATERRAERASRPNPAAAAARLQEARRGARDWSARLEQRAQREEAEAKNVAASLTAEQDDSQPSVRANRARLMRHWSERLAELGGDAGIASKNDRGVQLAAAATGEVSQAATRLRAAEQLRLELKASVREWPQQVRKPVPTMRVQASRAGRFTAKKQVRKA